MKDHDQKNHQVSLYKPLAGELRTQARLRALRNMELDEYEDWRADQEQKIEIAIDGQTAETIASAFQEVDESDYAPAFLMLGGGLVTADEQLANELAEKLREYSAIFAEKRQLLPSSADEEDGNARKSSRLSTDVQVTVELLLTDVLLFLCLEVDEFFPDCYIPILKPSPSSSSSQVGGQKQMMSKTKTTRNRDDAFLIQQYLQEEVLFTKNSSSENFFQVQELNFSSSATRVQVEELGLALQPVLTKCNLTNLRDIDRIFRLVQPPPGSSMQNEDSAVTFGGEEDNNNKYGSSQVANCSPYLIYTPSTISVSHLAIWLTQFLNNGAGRASKLYQHEDYTSIAAGVVPGITNRQSNSSPFFGTNIRNNDQQFSLFSLYSGSAGGDNTPPLPPIQTRGSGRSRPLVLPLSANSLNGGKLPSIPTPAMSTVSREKARARRSSVDGSRNSSAPMQELQPGGKLALNLQPAPGTSSSYGFDATGKGAGDEQLVDPTKPIRGVPAVSGPPEQSRQEKDPLDPPLPVPAAAVGGSQSAALIRTVVMKPGGASSSSSSTTNAAVVETNAANKVVAAPSRDNNRRRSSAFAKAITNNSATSSPKGVNPITSSTTGAAGAGAPAFSSTSSGAPKTVNLLVPEADQVPTVVPGATTLRGAASSAVGSANINATTFSNRPEKYAIYTPEPSKGAASIPRVDLSDSSRSSVVSGSSGSKQSVGSSGRGQANTSEEETSTAAVPRTEV